MEAEFNPNNLCSFKSLTQVSVLSFFGVNSEHLHTQHTDQTRMLFTIYITNHNTSSIMNVCYQPNQLGLYILFITFVASIYDLLSLYLGWFLCLHSFHVRETWCWCWVIQAMHLHWNKLEYCLVIWLIQIKWWFYTNLDS
jgi:hypothetical protein